MIQVSVVVTAVRHLVQDTSPSNPRYDDQTVLLAVTAALLRVKARRPEAFPFGPTPAVTMGGSIPIDDIFMPALVKLAAGELLLINSEYAESGAAASVIQLGDNYLTGR
jgi:hypothetical protein